MKPSWFVVLAIMPVSGGGMDTYADVDLCSDLILAIDGTSRDLSPLRGAYDSEDDRYLTSLRLLPGREADSCGIVEFDEEEPSYVACTEKVKTDDVRVVQAMAKHLANEVTSCLQARRRRYTVLKDWAVIAPGDSGNSYWRTAGGAKTAFRVGPLPGAAEVIVKIYGRCRETIKRREMSCFLGLSTSQRLYEDE